ncbi:hypothetical protein [Campylobacter suis]|uniref:Uncharacterized protein n=1 Tax=Campylobacter suis TaxID=2790657 RepID=A0ABN7KBD1_9BACT|nr:hypothetical protein [Campylobacter suis]CAD7289410.1 hypothetical protein LMG8286_01790 [Campylobacter suis]
MLNSLNGLSSGRNFGYRKLSNNLNNLSEIKTAKTLDIKMDFNKFNENWRKELKLDDNESLNVRRIFSLSGYTKDDKISMWGKINGLDTSISKNESDSLKRFIDSTKALSLDYEFGYAGQVFKVDELIDKFDIKLGTIGTGLGISLVSRDASKLLDADMDVKEFKNKWLEYAVEKILGDRANVKISLEDDSLLITQTSANKRVMFFNQTPQNRVIYENEQSKQQFLDFLKNGFENDKNIGDILNEIAIKTLDAYNVAQEEYNTDDNFTPIQSQSKNNQDYDINKDDKFIYERELLKREQERGIDVLHLMQKLEENGYR